MAIASWPWILWRHFSLCIGAKVHFIFSMKFCTDLTARTTGMRDTSDRCVFNCSTTDRSATVGCFYNNSVDFCQSWMGLKHLRRWKQFPVNLLSLKSIPWWFNVTFFLCACWWRNAQLHHGVQILYRLFSIFQRYSWYFWHHMQMEKCIFSCSWTAAKNLSVLISSFILVSPFYSIRHVCISRKQICHNVSLIVNKLPWILPFGNS